MAALGGGETEALGEGEAVSAIAGYKATTGGEKEARPSYPCGDGGRGGIRAPATIVFLLSIFFMFLIFMCVHGSS